MHESFWVNAGLTRLRLGRQKMHYLEESKHLTSGRTAVQSWYTLLRTREALLPLLYDSYYKITWRNGRAEAKDEHIDKLGGENPPMKRINFKPRLAIAFEMRPHVEYDATYLSKKRKELRPF